MSTPAIEISNVPRPFTIFAGFLRGKPPPHSVPGVTTGIAPGDVLGLVVESGSGVTLLA